MMIDLSEIILNFIVNASWQIIAVASLAALCELPLKKGPARYRHLLWVVALVLSVALPIWTVTRADTGKTAIPASESRIVSATGVAPTIKADAGSTISRRDFTYLLQPRPQPLSTNSSLILAFAAAYAVFIFLRGLLLFRAWFRTRILIRSIHQRELSPHLRAVYAESLKVLRVSNVLIACSPLTTTPSTVGTRRPLIILPDWFYAETSVDVLRSVLGHELAHIRRRDFTLNVAYELLLLPIAFHPVTRFIKRQIDSTRELACDEMVTERLLKPESHARSLVEIAGSLVTPAHRAFNVGIFDANILEERIMKLTQNTRRVGARASRLLTVTSLLLLAISTLAVSTFSFELRAARNMDRTRVTLNAPPAALEARAVSSQPTFIQPARLIQAAGIPERRVVTPATQSSDPQELAQAACDARTQQTLEAIPRLLSILGDDREITPFPCLTNRRWTPALSSFKHPSPGEQAALALASMGAAAFGPLTEALHDSSPVARRNAAWAIGELTNMPPGERADAVMPLIALLRDNHTWVRMAAARALGELRDSRAGEPLVAALLDTAEGVRLISAWALGEMKDQRAVDSLSNVLVSDARIEVRVAAAEALGEIRNPRAIASLNQALNDAEPRVRSKARWALDEIGDSDG